MPNLTLDLTANGGALIEMSVEPSEKQSKARKKEGLPPVNPEVVNALVDTGAGITIVAPSLVERLGLVRTGEIEVRTVAAEAEMTIFATYAILLRMPRPVPKIILPGLRVAGGAIPYENIGLLLGRDVLSRCVFIYNGPAKLCTLSF